MEGCRSGPHGRFARLVRHFAWHGSRTSVGSAPRNTVSFIGGPDIPTPDGDSGPDQDGPLELPLVQA
jgi:hypothetical protein